MTTNRKITNEELAALIEKAQSEPGVDAAMAAYDRTELAYARVAISTRNLAKPQIITATQTN